jgi:predicted AlkP superfamily phosphohydrolase/phosphomutase
MDKILGEILKNLDKKDTIIVLSDHGFNTFRRAAHINSWLRAHGYLQLQDPEAEKGKELLHDVDWSQTRAYSVGFGGIYLNMQGREGKGIVPPGEEAERLKKEIADRLKSWKDDQNNLTIVNRVYLKEEIFNGPYADEAPDLNIGFQIGYRASWQSALGAVPEELIEDNLKKWSGTHLCDASLVPGIILSNKEITKKNPSIYDILPTILHVTGIDNKKMKAENFDGKPLWSDVQ